MSDRTSSLFALFALLAFRVLEVSLEPEGGRRVLVESLAVEGGCPGCGVAFGLIQGLDDPPLLIVDSIGPFAIGSRAPEPKDQPDAAHNGLFVPEVGVTDSRV